MLPFGFDNYDTGVSHTHDHNRNDNNTTNRTKTARKSTNGPQIKPRPDFLTADMAVMSSVTVD
jgi:hypothetical protein